MSEAKSESTPRWTAAFKRLWTLHWIMAACFLAIYGFGMVMTRIPDGVTFRGSMYNIHKSLGVLVLGLLLGRVFTLLQVFSKKYLHRKPRMTQQWILSALLHGVMYGFMLVVPILGMWYSNSAGHPISFFVINLPTLFGKNEAVVETAEHLHVWLAYVLVCFVGLHAIEQHQFIKRTWRRMVKGNG